MRRRADRWLGLGVSALLACTEPGDEAGTEPALSTGSETAAPELARPADPAPLPLATAALVGDPGDAEHEILAVGDVELGDEELLGLPGSQGFAIIGTGKGTAIPDGGASVGTPDAGSIEGGIQLPFDPAAYTRRDATRSYASTQTLRTIQTAFTTLRRERGVDAEVLIGDISLPRGGAFAPHVSHRSGRDLDIRLILAEGLDRTTLPFAPEQVDWDATWALVHSFLETGHVTYVFLEFGHQAHLHRAARRAGVHAEVLAHWFQWPDAFDATAIVRHEQGHRAHLHIRLSCEGQGPRCHGM